MHMNVAAILSILCCINSSKKFFEDLKLNEKSDNFILDLIVFSHRN